MNDTIDSLSPILSNDGNSVYIGVGTSIVSMDAETGNQPLTTMVVILINQDIYPPMGDEDVIVAWLMVTVFSCNIIILLLYDDDDVGYVQWSSQVLSPPGFPFGNTFNVFSFSSSLICI